MSKKKDKFVFKKRTPPKIIEVIDRKPLQSYVWNRNGIDEIPVDVVRLIGLGSRNEGDEPKAYWFIVETQHFEKFDNTLTYGFYRRPEWDR